MRCPSCQAENDNDAISCFTCGAALAAVPQIRRGSVIAGRYEILEPLGKGGMGMVYKAHDRELDETVALKLLRQDIAADPEMQKRFRAEVKLARRVRHRNVCGIHEFGADGNLRFIAMEFIEGVDMRQILTRKGAPLPEEAFEISIQVGQGLQAIHDVGIVHRDLKTPNIMRDSRGHVRLMDFGIAKQLGAEATMGATQMGMIVGTPEYMSPEQARGEKIDFRSDIYALGVVIFEIFTGHVPFRGETPIATIFKHLQEPPPLEGPGAAGLPVPLLPVLARALAKSASDRYANVLEMVEALQEARMQAYPQARSAPTAPMRAVGEIAPTPLPGTTVMPTPMPTRHPTGGPTAVRAQAPATVVTPPPTVQTPATPAPAVDPERERREARMRELLGRAEELASAQKLSDAEQVLREAVQVEPSHTLAQRLLASVVADLQRAHAEEERRARETAEQEARARADRDARETAERGKKAQQEKAERQARESADRQAREKAEADARARAAEDKRKADEARRREEDDARRKAEARARDEAARRKADEEKRRREADEEKRRREAAAAAAGAVTPAGPARSGIPVPLIAGGALALVMAIGAGVYLLRSAKPAPPVSPEVVATSPEVVPLEPSPADVVPMPAAGLGMLVIDATPWAEVVEIVAADGQKHAVPDKAYTPLVVSLPPGEYRVSLRNPAHGAQTVTARVQTEGVAASPRAAFARVDAQQYFEATGW